MPRKGWKKPDRKATGITVPLSVDLAERLRAAAEQLGTTKTELARDLLEKGLAA